MTAPAAKPVLCRVDTRPADGTATLSSLTHVISRQSRPAILGGNDSVGRYSIFCAEPVEIFTFEDGQNNPFEKLQSFLEKYKLEKNTPCFSDSPPLPGWIGFFAYPLAHYIEKLPRPAKDDLSLPLIHMAFYDKAIIHDHKSGTFSLVVLDYPGQAQTADEKFRLLQAGLDEAAAASAPVHRSLGEGGSEPISISLKMSKRKNPVACAPGFCFDNLPKMPLRFTTNMTRNYYFDALRKIKQYIFDGDVYQINFSQRFECDFAADPADYFLWQSRHNPAPYAAYLSTPDFSIVSASPELFLRTDGDSILTRPIKGTRPRRSGPDSDTYNFKQFKDLSHSPKDHAELMMIVDLERNDLAKVCIPGTRHVQCLRTIEAWPTLFHAVAEVAGTLPRLNDPALFCEILRAVFPGGSITGAPKIRAMEILSELEPTSRGLYTGCIGHIGIDFQTTLNIAIRTVVICNHKAYVQTGGGIVADSDPQAEWEEMQLKADALLAGLNAITFTPAQPEGLQ
jgi:anthranilate/para-aminobenzoate synthase component I